MQVEMSPSKTRLWDLSKKHFHVSPHDGRFVKLNRFENRLNARDLQFYIRKGYNKYKPA